MFRSLLFILAAGSALSSFAQAFKDQGIWNEFHKQNLGKIVFSSEKIVHNSPNPKLVKTQFNLSDVIKGRLYLDKSLANRCAALESSGKYAADEFNYDKFKVIKLEANIYVDGVLQSTFYDAPGEEAQRTEWTTWWYGFTPYSENHWYDFNENTPEYEFGKVLRDLGPGKHTIRISYSLCSLNPRFNSRVEIAKGQFQLNFDEKAKAAWLEKHREMDEVREVEEPDEYEQSPGRVEEAVNRYVEIKITNNLSTEFKYYYNGGQNYINSGGVKSYTCNPGDKFYFNTNGSSGKLFLEVTPNMNGRTFKTSEFK